MCLTILQVTFTNIVEVLLLDQDYWFKKNSWPVFKKKKKAVDSSSFP